MMMNSQELSRREEHYYAHLYDVNHKNLGPLPAATRAATCFGNTPRLFEHTHQQPNLQCPPAQVPDLIQKQLDCMTAVLANHVAKSVTHVFQTESSVKAKCSSTCTNQLFLYFLFFFILK